MLICMNIWNLCQRNFGDDGIAILDAICAGQMISLRLLYSGNFSHGCLVQHIYIY